MNALKMKSSWKALLDQVSAVSDRLDEPDPLADVDAAIKDLVFYDDSLDPEVGGESGPTLEGDRPISREHLVHYTSWENALAILKEEKPVIRSYNYERTNDPQEGRLWRSVWDAMKKDADWFDGFLPAYDQTLLASGRSVGTTFGCCFSAGGPRVEDNLTFWRLYGNDGKGCSFKVTSRLPHTYRVRYLDERRKNRNGDEEVDRQVGSWLCDLLTSGRELVEQFWAAGNRDAANRMAGRIRKVLGGYNHLAKSSYFEDEKEWRMIDVFPTDTVLYDTDEAGVVRRYVPSLPLEHGLITGSSITVGPQVPNGGAARAYIEHLVKEYMERSAKAKGLEGPEGSRDPEYAFPEVKLSKQTYRSAP